MTSGPNSNAPAPVSAIAGAAIEPAIDLPAIDLPAIDLPAIDLNARHWSQVRARLRLALGDTTFNSWLKGLSLISVDADRAVLGSPTRFLRDWVVSHYGDRLRLAWAEENPAIVKVEIVVRTDVVRQQVQGRNTPEALSRPELRSSVARSDATNHSIDRRQSQDFSGAVDAQASENSISEHAVHDGLGAPLDPRFTFDAFVVGKSNELAHAAARRVAEANAVTFNPLFLYGGVGLGKTHLMHAIAWEIRRRSPERRVIYLSAEKFMYQFIRALRFKDTMAFKQAFRSVDVLMIDDVQFISGKDSTQEEFFHTFNALIDHNRQVVISADRSPSDLEGMEERIRSRLGWGLVADIHPTDYELRLGILQAKADTVSSGHGGCDVPPRVLEFLAHRITSNIRELEGALTRVVAFATLVGRPITLDMTQEVLQDLLRANDRRLSIDDIQRKVAEYYNLRMSDMLSARRSRVVARPRQIAMYLSKQLTPRSLPEIGRRFGGRDHTTVMHAVKKIEELRAIDASLSEDIDLLRRMLEG
jgi:chromosomal replication initiator protein